MRALGEVVASLNSQLQDLRAMEEWRSEVAADHPEAHVESPSMIRCSCGARISTHRPFHAQAFETHWERACMSDACTSCTCKSQIYSLTASIQDEYRLYIIERSLKGNEGGTSEGAVVESKRITVIQRSQGEKEGETRGIRGKALGEKRTGESRNLPGARAKGGGP